MRKQSSECQSKQATEDEQASSEAKEFLREVGVTIAAVLILAIIINVCIRTFGFTY